jgi:hypothetical protein
VRDSGRARDDYEDHLRQFTAEEIWMCDLATAVGPVTALQMRLMARQSAYGLEVVRTSDRTPLS